MNDQQQLNYNRIAQAIEYITEHFKEQPQLDEVAEMVHLSPFHFQRLFKEWAGTTPKKFLQYTSLQYAKRLLQDQQATLFDTAYQTGLSGTGRLHDLFIQMEGMTPAEFKNGGRNLSIQYSFADSPFGKVIVASTSKGICHMAFEEDEDQAVWNLQQKFPFAKYQNLFDDLQANALSIFQTDWTQLKQIKLHLKGTEFQLKVWEALLKIPFAGVSTYGKIADQIGQPTASRAVGTAIGSNPVAFLIPCHRVIQSTGYLGGYMWGKTRKTAMLGWEAAKSD
ncbi:bifunctional helix-turn-helix domain-containing protein/methylated-DNA--[protein]-cysteine S-methyltransferase [Leadbetterella byssophila]|uniref:bifunctional helix-turn-helix domain-containing protein/methylated-DNA--[protein]-cysteine S-methyltransferase n=1 Tax=Leadbetterella byssophila TaxID=316068 RepID=UPI00399FFA2B